MKTYHLVEHTTAGPILSPVLKGAFSFKPVHWTTKTQQDRRWISNQHMWLLIHQNTGLHSLVLNLQMDTLATIHSMKPILDILASLPRLIHFESGIYRLDTNRLIECSPRPQRLRTGFFTPGDRLLAHPSPHLRDLFVKVCISSRNFFRYLRAFPNLERIKMAADMKSGVCFETEKILGNTSSRLKEIIFPTTFVFSDNNMANHILPWLPGLTRITVNHLQPATVRALATHCKGLRGFQQFKTSPCQPNTRSYEALGDMLNELLWDCTALTDIDAPDYRVDLDCSLAYPWRRLGLELLRFRIHGIIRLTESEVAVLEQKFSTLGILTTFGLQTGPGAGTRPDPVPDTLELSLKSGLDQLATLSELEVFGFEYVDHKIGKAELAWIAAHWKRLKEMRRLQQE
ncbi:hypothetical protein BGX23_003422 [Mortierella sp. AD031]|nr:hypothetical protein BGX23_003422 [Mortierella sp. AD031]